MMAPFGSIPEYCQKCEEGPQPWTKPVYEAGQMGWYMGSDAYQSPALRYTCRHCCYEHRTEPADFAAMRRERSWNTITDEERFYRTVWPTAGQP